LKIKERVFICGIVGIVSKNKFSYLELLSALKRLEYRGYDSFGFATNSGQAEKDVGEIVFNGDGECDTAIAHTRWSTHGAVTKENAHPHSDCTNSLYIVHNGIIENYLELKETLQNLGHVFSSETDSEVIAHFFEEELGNGKSMEHAVSDFFSTAKGTFAILLIKKGEGKIYALKRDSPLVLGVLEDGFIVASDIYAFSNKTDTAIFFEDDEFAIIDQDGFRFFDANRNSISKETHSFEWQSEEQKKDFEHYMIKEIHEEPIVAERLIKSLQTTQKDKLLRLKQLMEKSKKIMFVASGTSYHASLLGAYFFNKVGISTQTLIASEFKNFMLPDNDTLVIAITQSGETMDVIEALKIAKQQGATIVSFVNVPYSTIQRMSSLYIEILAGQEVCVAATKSFVNQVVLLLKIASLFGYENGVEAIPGEIREVLNNEGEIKRLAGELKDQRDIYLIGRGLSYPVAREIALKLKEISYIHAEGMMGGELKHGTLALIEERTPVITLIPKHRSEIISNAKEVEARRGRIIAITNATTEFREKIEIKTVHESSFAILATVVGQLLTYYIAKERGLPIDKPRNLAKSVTVL